MAEGLLTSEDDSKYVGQFFRRACDADVQLNRYRQASKLLSREFIDDRFLSADRRSDISMGHSPEASRRHYGQDHDTLECMT
jgi:hypothetical protein